MLDDYERRRLRRLHRLGPTSVSDVVCAGIERLTRGELREAYDRELDLLRSPELPELMTSLRAKLIETCGNSRGVSVRGTQIGHLESLGRIRRAMPSAPAWRAKHPILDAPIPDDFFDAPSQEDDVA